MQCARWLWWYCEVGAVLRLLHTWLFVCQCRRRACLRCRMTGISSRKITHVILTHCHADHDAGTFQKILLEQRVTVSGHEIKWRGSGEGVV